MKISTVSHYLETFAQRQRGLQMTKTETCDHVPVHARCLGARRLVSKRFALAAALFGFADLLGLCAVTTGQVYAAQPFQVTGPAIVEDVCDYGSPNYIAADDNPNLNVIAAFGFPDCVGIYWPTAQTIYAPRGNVVIDIPVMLMARGTNEHATFNVTVTAVNTTPAASGNGFSGTASGSTTLYDWKASDAPSGASYDLQQAQVGTPAFGNVMIPMNLDTSGVTLTFAFSLSQGSPTSNPDTFGCGQAFECWTNSANFDGPNNPNAPGGCPSTGCPGNPGSPFMPLAMQLLPSALFQIGYVPIAIVYAPLGNLGKSSFKIQTTTGENISVGTNATTTNTQTQDSKTSVSGGISLSGDTGNVQGSGGFTASGSWDNSVAQAEGSAYGLTNALVTSDQISQTFPNGPPNPKSSPPALNQVSYWTQPFWDDIYLIAINSQFAAWDYPAGALVQPLGNRQIVQATVGQLSACVTNGSMPISYPELPSQGNQTIQTTMQGADCASLLSMDPFFVATSQSAVPSAYRLIFSGNTAANGATYDAQDSLASTITNTNQKTTSLTVTSTQTNSEDVKAGLSFLNSLLGFSFDATTVNTNTSANQMQVAYNTSDATTLTSLTDVNTVVSDTGNLSPSYNVVQDAFFGTLAIQDTDMHFTKPTLPVFTPLPPFILGPIATVQPCPPSKVTGPNGQTYLVPGPNCLGPIKYVNPATTLASGTKQAVDLVGISTQNARRYVSRPIPRPASSSFVHSAPAQFIQTLMRYRIPAATLNSLSAKLKG